MMTPSSIDLKVRGVRWWLWVPPSGYCTLLASEKQHIPLRRTLFVHEYFTQRQLLSRQEERSRRHRLRNRAILHSFKHRVSALWHKSSPHPCATKQEEQQLPRLHPYMVQLKARLTQASHGFYPLRRIKMQESARGPTTCFSIGPD